MDTRCLLVQTWLHVHQRITQLSATITELAQKKTDNSETCFCNPGYEGTTCSTEIKCTKTPTNCTQCRMETGVDKCKKCKDGYALPTCANVTPCTSTNHATKCNNNGTCAKKTDNSETCFCKTGFSGTTCETKSDVNGSNLGQENALLLRLIAGIIVASLSNLR